MPHTAPLPRSLLGDTAAAPRRARLLLAETGVPAFAGLAETLQQSGAFEVNRQPVATATATLAGGGGDPGLPDLVVIGLRLPDRRGTEVARQALLREIPILIIAAGPAGTSHCDRRLYPCLEAPVSAAVLTAAVYRVLAEGRRSRCDIAAQRRRMLAPDGAEAAPAFAPVGDLAGTPCPGP